MLDLLHVFFYVLDPAFPVPYNDFDFDGLYLSCFYHTGRS